MSEWQPIESAPEQKGFIALVYCADECPQERIMMGELSEDYAGGWDWNIHIDGQRIYLTHWTPLPKPPCST